MGDQPTINDLPVECVDEILKWITDREDRIYARFVCKLWCALIDQNCSVECYQIDPQRMVYNPLYQDATKSFNGFYTTMDFSKIVSLFLNSQRKKTSFQFSSINFKGSEQFWRAKGANIISLYFNFTCTHIPLGEIVEYCSVLKTLTIILDRAYISINKEVVLKTLLESCIINRKHNFSVRFLYLERLPLEEVTAVAKLVGQVFLGVQKVFFKDVFSDKLTDCDLHWIDEVNSFSTSFENLKFVITLSCSEGTFMFEPSESGNVIVKMTSLSIALNYMPITDIFAYLSRYSCTLNHLNRLDLCSWQGYCRLDDLHKLIANCLSLKSVYVTIASADLNDHLTNPLSKNNIESLRLLLSTFEIINRQTTIDDVFLQSFENLKLFECKKLTFSDFILLLDNLPCLEKLFISEGTVDVNRKQIISNKILRVMRMPDVFLLQTIAKYDFCNLKKLYINNDYTAKIGPMSHKFCNLDEHLKRVNCPKLENLELNFDVEKWRMNQDELTRRTVNILALFPRLTVLMFAPGFNRSIRKKARKVLKITDEMLKIILAKNRRLKRIGYHYDEHFFNIISPSHIEHRCRDRQSVLYLP